MAFGILLASLVVSSILVPAVTALAGRRAWWPGQVAGERATAGTREEPAPQPAHARGSGSATRAEGAPRPTRRPFRIPATQGGRSRHCAPPAVPGSRVVAVAEGDCLPS